MNLVHSGGRLGSCRLFLRIHSAVCGLVAVQWHELLGEPWQFDRHRFRSPPVLREGPPSFGNARMYGESCRRAGLVSQVRE